MTVPALGIRPGSIHTSPLLSSGITISTSPAAKTGPASASGGPRTFPYLPVEVRQHRGGGGVNTGCTATRRGRRERGTPGSRRSGYQAETLKLEGVTNGHGPREVAEQVNRSSEKTGRRGDYGHG